MKCTITGCLNEAVTRSNHCANHAKRLSINPGDKVDVIDEHAGCKVQIHQLERSLGEIITKHEQLQQIYQKLADQWNVFQATNRPDNRNIQRAEGAGEMARKLAEILLGAAYATDVRDILRTMLDQMEGAGGQDVEAYPAGRLPTAKRLGPHED